MIPKYTTFVIRFILKIYIFYILYMSWCMQWSMICNGRICEMDWFFYFFIRILPFAILIWARARNQTESVVFISFYINYTAITNVRKGIHSIDSNPSLVQIVFLSFWQARKDHWIRLVTSIVHCDLLPLNLFWIRLN